MDNIGFKLKIEENHEYDETVEKAIKSKMPRQRKRDFYITIRKQMEFYFGDANLSKDRFLMKLIKEDKYVPLEIFLKFNKIKKLVSTSEEIAKALEHSDFLQLNVDKTKVCRITEIPENWNADDRTIYVESLPPTADHDWLKNIFNRFGTVAYVSLPKFKTSKKIKEFGFVEFETIESAEKAINAFKSLGSIIASDNCNLENLTSIRSYLKEQSEDNQNIKRKRNSSDSVKDEDAKRIKIDESNQSGLEEDTSDSNGEKDHQDNENETEHKKKKRRRKKKKNPKKSIDFDLSELKVLSKIEWKKLRNKYLNMQRKKVSEIKQEIRKKHGNRKIITKSRDTTEKRVEVKKPQSMNFYGAGQDNEDDGKIPEDDDKTIKNIISPALERKPLFKYEPDLIVKIKMYTPCVDIKNFKSEMRQYPGVMYVDISEGSFEAFIRCQSSKYAKNFKKRISCAEYVCEILSGDQEIEYWNKMMKDREMKLNKMVKAPYKRGKQKLAAVTAKHILFNDSE